ncbi:hypothetical protein [Nostoc sp.]
MSVWVNLVFTLLGSFSDIAYFHNIHAFAMYNCLSSLQTAIGCSCFSDLTSPAIVALKNPPIGE